MPEEPPATKEVQPEIEENQPENDHAALPSKPMCPYGYECLRKNAQHLEKYDHPNEENDEDMVEVKGENGSVTRKRKTETYSEKWKKRRVVEEESIQKTLKIQKSYSLAARHLSTAIDPNHTSSRHQSEYDITPARKSQSRAYLKEFLKRASSASDKKMEPKTKPKPKIGKGFKPGEEFTL